MATVSANVRVTLTAALITAVLASGCSTLAPVQKPASEVNGADTGAGQVRQAGVPSREAPLPKQAYDRNGNKVRYVPQPNPYTASAAAVPPEARSLFVVASGQLKDGDMKGAQAQFRRLTEKYPDLSGPWLKLGDIEERNGNPDKAVEYYRKAISLNSSNVNAYIALGLAQRRLGRFAEAQAAYLDALDLWRDFPEAHLNLAILYDLYANQPEDAQKHYEAYYFLTGEKDEKVHKWLVEVRRRTGIDRSFIDTPPREMAEVPGREAGQPETPESGASPG